MPLSPVRHVLDNGLRLITVENRTMPAVCLLAGVRAGAFDDHPGLEGTAALAARVLDRGTDMRSAAAIADDLDGRGASLGVGAGRHMTTLSAVCLSQDFDAVASIVADVLLHPAFDAREVETRRAELVTTIRQEEDDPTSRAVTGLAELLYGSHPYARRSHGTVESIERVTRDELIEHHRRSFVPPATTVIVVGDVEPLRVNMTLGDAFGAWSQPWPGLRSVPDVVGPRERQLRVQPMMAKAQADIAYGFVGLRRTDPAYYAALVMNNALGQYGLGGRLGDVIREREGMAYYVLSALDATVGPGPLAIRAGVAPSNVERTVALIDAELAAIRRQGFTATELADSKQYLSGSLPRQLETNAAIASFLLSADLFDLGLDFDVRLPALVSAVTDEQVHEAARRLLDPTRAAVSVAGPWEGPPA
jgi:zinc protease